MSLPPSIGKKPFKLWTIGELSKRQAKHSGIRLTGTRGALTLRWGQWKNLPYDIPLKDLQTERGILKWTLHLADKPWVTREQLADFMDAALKVAGIDIHQPF
jgi:hypothetical protein